MDVDTSDKVPLLLRFPAIEHYFQPGNPLGIINSLEQVRTVPSPHLIKTRLHADFYQKQVTNGTTKAIAILRNPKDMLVSFYHFYRMNRGYAFNQSWHYFFDMFKEKQLFWGDWTDHVISWWKLRNKPNVLIVKYEDLKKDLRGQIQRIAQFCGKDPSDVDLDTIEKRTTFESMKENPSLNFSCSQYVYDFSKAPFMRNGTAGGWKDWFSQEQSQYIDSICRELTEQYELNFDFEL